MASHELPPDMPRSVEAEQAVIGGLLIDPSGWGRIDQITEDDFYSYGNRIAFKLMAEMHSRDEDVDVITLSEYAKSQGVLDEIGGIKYLGELARETPSASNVATYSKILIDRSKRREAIKIASRMVSESMMVTNDGFYSLIESVVSNLTGLATESEDKAKGATDIVKSMIGEMEASIEGVSNNIKTGIDCLDSIAPMRRGSLLVTGARPSMGKSALSMREAEGVCSNGGNVLVFSLEMTNVEIAKRMVSGLGRIPLSNIMDEPPSMDELEWQRFSVASTRLGKFNLSIDDTGLRTVQDICAISRKHHAIKKIDLIIIDHMHIMGYKGTEKRKDLQYSEITGALKSLAKELNCCVHLLAQLNRSLENRPDRRPRMSDLREAGSLEQDADTARFIYRDEVYNPNTQDSGIAEIIYGKNRNGATGTRRLDFLANLARFDEHQRPKFDDF